MHLKCKFDGGEFAVLAELIPPKGTDVSLMLDHASKARDVVDAFVVTKRQRNGQAVVFRAPAGRLQPGEPVPLEQIAEFRFEEGVFVTAADVSTDGAVVAFRGYNEVWMWVRTDLTYE